MGRAGALWISLALAGCAGTSAAPAGRPVGEVYRAAARRALPELRVEPPVGYVRPYVPVLTHPEVFSVYVLPHTTEGGTVSVQGHWVHLRLREARFWHEDQEEAPTFGLEGLPFRRGPEPAPPPASEPHMEEVPKDEGTR